jgi:hypothetical protein
MKLIGIIWCLVIAVVVLPVSGGLPTFTDTFANFETGIITITTTSSTSGSPTEATNPFKQSYSSTPWVALGTQSLIQ